MNILSKHIGIPIQENQSGIDISYILFLKRLYKNSRRDTIAEHLLIMRIGNIWSVLIGSETNMTRRRPIRLHTVDILFTKG